MPEPTENPAVATSAENTTLAANEPMHERGATDESHVVSSVASSTESSGETRATESSGADASNASEASESSAGGTEAAEDDADSDGGEEASAEGGEAGGEAGEGGEKKKRRRRRRRKGGTLAGEAAPGAEGQQNGQPGQPGQGHEGRSRKRDGAMAPLQRFFGGSNAGKRHGFAVGEVVAGRVKEVANGVITVDLFGKALAFVDEHEPREVAMMLPPSEQPTTVGSPSPVADESVAAAETTSATEAAPQAAVASETVASEAAVEAPAAAVEATEEQQAADAVAPLHAQAAAAAEEHAEAEAAVDDELDDDHEAHGAGGRGPMHPLPIVPEELGRPEAPALGQVFRGRVGLTSESGHIALVNRLVDRQAVLAELEHARVSRRRVEGVVFGYNRGGFDVLVAGLRGFCPASAMALSEINDPNEHVGHKYEFLLPAGQTVASDVIVSRRSILERQQRKMSREMLKGLTPGQRFKGRVTYVRDFGLIVDIGGVEGLVHQTELSWQHGVWPGDVAKPGDEVEVQVLRIGAEGGRGDGPGRRDRMTRVGLSIKALLADPWDEHKDALREGCVQKGKVTRTTDFGAFIELAPNIEGLLHITELGRDLKHASQAVAEGDELHVVVERVDRQARRIALSRLTPAEVAEFEAGALEEGMRSVRPGARVTVKVERVEARGLLVRIQGVVGRRARGYIPRIEMGEAGGDLRKSYPQGSSLEVKIMGIDRDGGLRCSPKALAVDDERKAIKDYRREAARQGFGTFGDLLRAKLGEAEPK